MSAVLEAKHPREENPNVVAPTPSRLLKEKRSWRPFLAALRGEKWKASVDQVNDQSRSTGQYPVATDGVPWMAPASVRPESLKETMIPTTTLDPPFTEQSLAACSAESTPQLSSSPSSTTHFSPLPPSPTAMMMGATSRFSPCSATTFSPQTPEYLTPSLGTSMRVTGIQLGGEELRAQRVSPAHKPPQDSQGILSPTPGISPNIPLHQHQRYNTIPVNRLAHSKQFASETHLLLQKPAPAHLLSKGKSLTNLYSSTIDSQTPVFDDQGRDVRGPLHGLGLHVGWADERPLIDRKGKAKAETEADEQVWESGSSSRRLNHQASQLFKLQSAAAQDSHHQPLLSPGARTLASHLGRRPAVGILTNTRLSPTAASSTWHHSPSAVTVVEHDTPHAAGNLYNGPSVDHLEADDMTVVTTHHSNLAKPHHHHHHQRRDHRSESPSPSPSQAMINMHPRELQLQPAKLFFLLGFLLGPCKFLPSLSPSLRKPPLHAWSLITFSCMRSFL
jgi:hypothetical protein